MYLTIAVLVFLVVAIPGGMYWLLRPRKDVKPDGFHHQTNDIATLGNHHGESGSH